MLRSIHRQDKNKFGETRWINVIGSAKANNNNYYNTTKHHGCTPPHHYPIGWGGLLLMQRQRDTQQLCSNNSNIRVNTTMHTDMVVSISTPHAMRFGYGIIAGRTLGPDNAEHFLPNERTSSDISAGACDCSVASVSQHIII